MTLSHAPGDHYNRELIERTGPSGRQNPKPSGRYNLVVLGAGPAGLVVAAGAAGLGAKVALVERAFLGGDCLHYGCVPSKALLAAARVARIVRDAGAFGIADGPPGEEPPLERVGHRSQFDDHRSAKIHRESTVHDRVRVDFPEVMRRLRRLRARVSEADSVERFESLGVDVVLGHARLIDPHTALVGGQRYEGARVVIATGARPRVPDIQGLQQSGFFTNETVFSLTDRPNRWAVIGAGPIGCELAQAFARLGSSVTVFSKTSRVLANEDSQAAELVRQSLERDGARIVERATVREIRTDGDAKTIFGDGFEPVTVDAILVATGRAPNVEGMGLEDVGVRLHPDGIWVDDYQRTSAPSIYAAGDVCGKERLTHAADAMARLVIRNALFLGRAKASDLVIPRCVYTSPEVAQVGWTEEQCRQRGVRVDVFQQDLRQVDRAILDGEEQGFVKALTRHGTDQIVGATIVAEHAGEMINEITLAMTMKKGLKALGGVIHCYPTQSDAIRRLSDAHARTRLTPRLKSILGAILRVRRW